MAGRRSVRATRPKGLRVSGKGWVESDASGFIREAGQMVEDVRQGTVTKGEADFTPGFGTFHPQDVKNLGILDDPKAIRDANPIDDRNLSKQDLGISDQEVELSIKEDRPPRRGY